MHRQSSLTGNGSSCSKLEGNWLLLHSASQASTNRQMDEWTLTTYTCTSTLPPCFAKA